MITLALDASTSRGTVAILNGDRLILQESAPMRGRAAEMLMPAVGRALAESGHDMASVERVICGAGPGSFTSLRIAAAIAKGIAVGRDVPLYGVSSMALLVAGNVKDGPRGARRYLAVLDALRGESFVAEFEHEAGVVREVGEQRLVPTDAVSELAARSGARAVGPDQADHWLPHARGAALMLSAILARGAVNLAAWEPTYGRPAEAQAKWEATHGRELPR